MSYGILVQNPNINRVILDENHPIYVAPPIRVVGRQVDVRLVGDAQDPQVGWWYFFECRQEFELRFRFPLAGQLPPLLFISAGYPAEGWPDPNRNSYEGGIYAERPWGRMGPGTGQSDYSTYGWLSNLTYVPLGGSGFWTGIKVRTHSRETYKPLNGNGPKGYGSLMESLWSVTPNVSQYFMAVGYGVEPRPGEYGIIVRNADGEVVFNSNSNVAVGVGCNSNWQYINRNGGDGEYTERWQLPTAPPNDAYRLVIPTQTYRRYNGETATVAMQSYKGRMLRTIVGGRSGSPAFTPMMWIRTMKPVERW